MGIPGLIEKFQVSGAYTNEPLAIQTGLTMEVQRIRVNLQPGETLRPLHFRWTTVSDPETPALRISFFSTIENRDYIFSDPIGDFEANFIGTTNTLAEDLPVDVVVSYQNASGTLTNLFRPSGWWFLVVRTMSLP